MWCNFRGAPHMFLKTVSPQKNHFIQGRLPLQWKNQSPKKELPQFFQPPTILGQKSPYNFHFHFHPYVINLNRLVSRSLTFVLVVIVHKNDSVWATHGIQCFHRCVGRLFNIVCRYPSVSMSNQIHVVISGFVLHSFEVYSTDSPKLAGNVNEILLISHIQLGSSIIITLNVVFSNTILYVLAQYLLKSACVILPTLNVNPISIKISLRDFSSKSRSSIPTRSSQYCRDAE